MVSYAALAGASGPVVLHAVTGEHLEPAGAEPCYQQELHGGVQPNQVGGRLELILDDDVRADSFAIVLR